MDCVKANKEIFQSLFYKYGDDSKSCGWEQKMIMRYKELYKIGDINHTSVLDIGCGLGDLYDYFIHDKKVEQLTYTGVDIVPEMIEMAKKKYPEATFLVQDIVKKPLSKKFDWVFICGVFNQGMETEYMKKILKQAFLCCERGMAFNFISTYVNFTSEERSYHNPLEIFQFCIDELSPKVNIFHHYEKCDVSVFVYK